MQVLTFIKNCYILPTVGDSKVERMAKIVWKAGTMLAPVPPALISCGTMQKPNVMTAAWTGIVCSEPAMVYVSIRPERYSYDIIKKSGEFVINVPTVKLAKAVDWCGVKSGREIDKFRQAKLTALSCTKVKAPQIAESPISLECQVRAVYPLGSHDMFLAEVLAVHIDDTLLGADGALKLDKAGLLAYAHGFYYGLGKKIGKYGWSVEKKSTRYKRIMKKRAQEKHG